jgi:hypothetical protein
MAWRGASSPEGGGARGGPHRARRCPPKKIVRSPSQPPSWNPFGR